MKALWLFSAILLQFLLVVKCQDYEFITIIAPKQVYEGKDYNVVILPTNIDKRTEVSLYFRRNYGTIAVHPDGNDKISKVRIFNQNVGSKNFFNLTMILHRNETVNRKSRQMCMSETLNEIIAERKYFHTFIQTDKPIYKPGDILRFRILFVDRDLKPFHINNVIVKLFDSHNRVIKTFEDPGKGYNGVFSDKFTIDENTALGIWTISVVVEKNFQWTDKKTFAVQKVVLPPFDAHIFGSTTHLSTNGILRLSFYAKYSFGDFVKGNAKIVIKNLENNAVVYIKEYSQISEATQQEIKIRDDLNAQTRTRLEYEATVIFTEPESELKANKTLKFSVIADMNDKVTANHPEKFGPGLPFGIKASVRDWQDKLTLKSHELVGVDYCMVMKNGTDAVMTFDVRINNGIATKNMIIPDAVAKLTIKIKFKGKIHIDKEIPMGSAIIGVNQITVTHEPEFPKYNENVTIFVRADSELDSIISLVMTRNGNSEIHQRYCNFTTTCNFNINMKRDMMPKSKVIVYYVNPKKKIFQGETTIRTKELSGNYLDIGVPATIKPKEKVNVTITTRPESSVYLLAYDKRLKYLWEGNEVTRDDVIKDVAGSDGYNEIKKFHITKENWRDCTADEIKKIAKGRILLIEQSKDEFVLQTDDDIDYDEEVAPASLSQDKTDEHPEPLSEPAQVANDIREDFRDVFMFTDFKTSSSQITTKYYIVPDSITSWLVSAFSMNEKHGLAIAPTKEFSVKKDFFTKLAVPYSFRYKEKLRLDIIVHNYLDPKEDLKVDVTVSDKSSKQHLRFYNSLCDSTPTSHNVETKSYSVSSFQVKRFSFYIQSSAENQEFEQLSKIQVVAVGYTKSGMKVEDIMTRKLKIEPVGIKTYEIESKSFRLSSKINNTYDEIKNYDASNGFPKIRFAISGDYLSDSVNINTQFEFHPKDCLEQKTSKLKGNVEYLRYLQSKDPPIDLPSVGFSNSYQSILEQRRQKWNYRNKAGFRAYFLEAIASAMELKKIPENRIIIENELNALQSFQNENGSFSNFGNFPVFTGDSNSRETFETAYVLIPFLKFKKMIKKSYDDVLEKGFDFLNSSVLKSSENSLSMAAYAYGLNNEFNKSMELLLKVENLKLSPNGLQCYKIMRNLTDCDLMHTSYTMLAYIAIGNVTSAKKSISWLLSKHNVNKYFSNTHAHAVATEAIAHVLSGTKVGLTNYTVFIENEKDLIFNKIITKANAKDTFEVEVPDYSLYTRFKTTGVGYCTITKIIEKTTSLNATKSKFSLNVSTKPGNISNVAYVIVCATYHAERDKNSGSQTLFNVIYDVEFPSGYVYAEVVDEIKKTEIKYVSILNGRTRIQIYYNDFNDSNEYCVEIKVNKAFEVSKMQNAGVQVYDFEDKENIAINFYTFSGEC